MARESGIARVYAVIALRRVWPRAAAVYTLSAVVGALLSPPGIFVPGVLIERATTTRPLYMVLLLGWTALMLPALRPLFAAPELSYLRSLPLAPGRGRAGIAVCVLSAHAALALTWAFFAGPVPGFAALGAAAAGSLTSASRSARELSVALPCWLLSLALGPTLLAIAPAAVALLAGASSVWRSAGIARRGSTRTRRVRGRPSFPATVLLIALVRSSLATLGRTAVLVLLSGAAALLAIRNNQVTAVFSQVAVVLGVQSALAGLMVGGAAAHFLQSERRLAWLYGSASTWTRTGHVFAYQAGALYGGAASAVAAAPLLLVAPLWPALAGIAASALWGFAQSAMTVAILRWAELDHEVDSGRVFLGSAALLATALVVIVYAGWPWLALPTAAALFLVLAPLVRGARVFRASVDHRPDSEVPMLVIRQLSKSLGGQVILRDVELSFAGPGALLIRGDNGSGKSTLLRCVAGVWEPDAGEITLCGASLRAEPQAARRHLGYAPEAFDILPELTVGETLALIASLKGCALPDAELIERFGVDELRSQRMAKLSTGQRRRVALATAFMGDPWLAILDEPTNALDREGVRHLTELLTLRASRGMAALVASHDPTLCGAPGMADECLLEGGVLRRQT